MANLKAKQRNRMDDEQFALPSKRKYPIHDKAHAKSALSYAARSDTEGEESTIRAKVLKKYPGLKHTERKPMKGKGKKKGKRPPFKSRLQKFPQRK